MIHWMASVYGKLDELRRLPENWDGDGGLPISEEIMGSASRLLAGLRTANRTLPIPFIAPIPNGSLQLEWRRNEKYFEIEFLDKDTISTLLEDSTGMHTKNLYVIQQLAIENMLDRFFDRSEPANGGQ